MPVDGNDGYKNRGDRCEGLFRPFTAADVRVASMSVGHVGLPERNGRLFVQWTPMSRPAWVVIFGLSSSVSYRVEAFVPAIRHEFTWPKEIPARVGVDALAVLVRNSGPSGDVYPICGTGGDRSAYELAFSATERLTHVIIKITKDQQEIWRHGPFDPPSRDVQVAVPLNRLGADGNYKASFVANGAATDFQFEHRANRCSQQ